MLQEKTRCKATVPAKSVLAQFLASHFPSLTSLTFHIVQEEATDGRKQHWSYTSYVECKYLSMYFLFVEVLIHVCIKFTLQLKKKIH